LHPIDELVVDVSLTPGVAQTAVQLVSAAPFELAVVANELRARLPNLFAGAYAATRDPEFDAVFSIRCDAPSRLCTLLDAMGTRDLLLQIVRDRLYPSFDERSVQVRRFTERRANAPSTRQMYWTVRLARELAAAYSER
jgi:hypothetical protein